MFSLSKGADLNYLVQGGHVYWAFPFSKCSLLKQCHPVLSRPWVSEVRANPSGAPYIATLCRKASTLNRIYWHQRSSLFFRRARVLWDRRLLSVEAIFTKVGLDKWNIKVEGFDKTVSGRHFFKKFRSKTMLTKRRNNIGDDLGWDEVGANVAKLFAA